MALFQWLWCCTDADADALKRQQGFDCFTALGLELDAEVSNSHQLFFRDSGLMAQGLGAHVTVLMTRLNADVPGYHVEVRSAEPLLAPQIRAAAVAQALQRRLTPVRPQLVDQEPERRAS